MSSLYAPRRFLLSLSAMFLIGAPATVRAGAPLDQVLVIRQEGLKGDFLYWFARPSRTATEPRLLPSSQTGVPITVAVPADYGQPDTELRVLDPRRGRVARFPLRAPGASTAADSGPAQSLLRNSDFAAGTSYWSLERTPPASASSTLLEPGAAPEGASGRPIRFEIANLGTQNWHVQFHQTGLSLSEGQPYTLTFWARAPQSRPLSVHANVDTGDGHGIGLTADQLALTPQWRRFALLFTAQRTIPGHNRLTFILGDSLGTVELAGISFRAGRMPRPAGPTLIANADFAGGSDHWTLQAGPSPAAATMKLTDSGVPGGASKAVRLEISALGRKPWDIQLSQPGIDLQDGEPYTLTFWARASTSRPISAIVSLDREDWHNAGLDSRLTLSEAWTQYTLDFTALRVVPGHTRLTFVLGDALGSVDLAGITLQHDAAPSEPAGGMEVRLSPADFKYLQTVTVPVQYKGAPVVDASVSVQYGGAVRATVQLGAADNGAASFADVPADQPVTIGVKVGDQTAEFPRVARTGGLDPVLLPAYWTDVKTAGPPSASLPPGPASSATPLVGSWQAKPDNAGQTYRFTFNSDGTGSIRAVGAADAGGPPRSPVDSVFRWYLRGDGRQVVIGVRAYTWVVARSGPDEKLVLTDAAGKSHTLFRR